MLRQRKQPREMDKYGIGKNANEKDLILIQISKYSFYFHFMIRVIKAKPNFTLSQRMRAGKHEQAASEARDFGRG